MAQVSASASIYALISGTWTLLNDVSPWDTFWGIADNDPYTFLADTGHLKFKLDNSGGLYTPGGPSALAGFRRGLPVKLVVTYDNEQHVRFRGYIDEIQIYPAKDDKTVDVTALDWMDYAQRHPVKHPEILSNVRSSDLAQVVLADVPIPPLQTNLIRGVYPFKTSLDTVTDKSTVYSEFAKIALSEIGPIYLVKDRADGETLVVENTNTRHGWVEPTEFPLATDDSGLALNENDDFEINEDDTFVALNESAAVTLDSSILSGFEAPYGDMIINQVINQAYPRRIDASPQIMFQLDEAFEIAPGKTARLFEGTYADPAGGFLINADPDTMVPPEETTDYTANTAEDGSGTDITSDLSVNVSFGSDGFVATLVNNNAALMYVTKFNLRGQGIYLYNPVIYTSQDADSIEAYDVQSRTFNLKYRGGHNLSSVFSDSVVFQYAEPRVVLKTISFCANKSGVLMSAFLYTDIGDLRTIDIDELGIHGNYYIQGINARYDGKLIWVTYTVKEHPSILGGDLTGVSIEFNGVAGHALDFGPLIRVSGDGVTERTFSAWIYLESISTDIKAIIAPFADTGGVMFYTSSGTLLLYSNRHNSGPGAWSSSGTAMPVNNWYLAVCTYSHASTTNDPAFYVNGTLQTTTELYTPSGTLNSEMGTHIVIGNAKTATQDYTYPFKGQIYDPRIYNRILTAAEVTTLYNSGDPDPTLVTDGLIFGGLAVPTRDLADYIDQDLPLDAKIFENAYRSVGVMVDNRGGNPVVRAAP